MHTARVLLVLFTLGSGVSATLASDVASHKLQAPFQVRITATVLPTVCVTRAGKARSDNARIACRTSEVPSFSVPGRPDVLVINTAKNAQETEGQVPSDVHLNRLEPTAAGPETTDTDARAFDAARLIAPANTPPPEEIEVSF